MRAGRASVLSSMSFMPIPGEFVVHLGDGRGGGLHDLAGKLERLGAEAALCTIDSVPAFLEDDLAAFLYLLKSI